MEDERSSMDPEVEFWFVGSSVFTKEMQFPDLNVLRERNRTTFLVPDFLDEDF